MFICIIKNEYFHSMQGPNTCCSCLLILNMGARLQAEPRWDENFPVGRRVEYYAGSVCMLKRHNERYD